MEKGTRVITPQGIGSVAFVRMAPPSYTAPGAISVILDSQCNRPGYNGTIMPASDVRDAVYLEQFGSWGTVRIQDGEFVIFWAPASADGSYLESEMAISPDPDEYFRTEQAAWHYLISL
jgi:hypothetical protein